MTEKVWYLYKHVRLDTNKPFYIGIGKTKNYERAYRKTSRNRFWKNIVAKTEYKIEILFEKLTKEEAKAKEVELVKLYGRRDLGLGTLVNLTNGGDEPFSRNMTPEERKALSERNKGYKHTPEAKEKIRLAATNISEETRLKMSKSRKGKKRNLSEEALEKIRAAATNPSEETLRKRSEALTGRKMSDEAKKKMSDSAKLRCQRQKEAKQIQKTN